MKWHKECSNLWFTVHYIVCGLEATQLSASNRLTIHTLRCSMCARVKVNQKLQSKKYKMSLPAGEHDFTGVKQRKRLAQM